MKSERRHDLKQIWLAKFVDDIQQSLQPYWRLIAGVSVILALTAFTVAFISKGQRDAQQEGWTAFLEAVANRNSAAFSTVAEDHDGDTVAPWAQLSFAQAKLIEACSAVHFDRVQAKKDFESAVGGFKHVLDLTTEALLEQRAQFGLGQAYEGLNDLDEAIIHYTKLADTESALGKQAAGRLKSLQDPRTQEFYKWFFAQKPPLPALPGSGDAPGLPFGQLPSEPNITMPSFPQSNDLDIDFGPPLLDDAAETSGTGIFDTLDTDAAETLGLDAPKTSDVDADADETALDNDTAGPDADGAEDSNEN